MSPAQSGLRAALAPAWGTLLVPALLVGACATPRTMPDDHSWFYRAGYGTAADDDRPIALFGPPETSALYILECDRAAGVMAIVSVDVEPFEGARPLGLRVGGVRWSGVERMDPPDGQAMSRALVPLDHPVMDAIAAGRGPILIVHPQGAGPLPGGEVPARAVNECRRRGG